MRIRRNGWSFVEVLVVISIVGILCALLFPAVQAVRHHVSGVGTTNAVFTSAEEAEGKPIIEYHRVQGEPREYIITTAPFTGAKDVVAQDQFRVLYGEGNVTLQVPLRYLGVNEHLQRQVLETAIGKFTASRPDLKVIERHPPYVHVSTSGGENYLYGIRLDVEKIAEAPWIAEQRAAEQQSQENAPAPNGTQFVSFSPEDPNQMILTGKPAAEADDPTGGFVVTFLGGQHGQEWAYVGETSEDKPVTSVDRLLVYDEENQTVTIPLNQQVSGMDFARIVQLCEATRESFFGAERHLGWQEVSWKPKLQLGAPHEPSLLQGVEIHYARPAGDDDVHAETAVPASTTAGTEVASVLD